MGQYQNRVPLVGSAVPLIPGMQPIGEPHAGEVTEVSLYLRPHTDKGAPPPLEELAAARDRGEDPLTHDELEGEHGTSAADLALVAKFAADHGLKVVESDALKRRVKLSGKSSELEQAFSVKLLEVQNEAGTFRSHQGDVHVPTELEGIVRTVVGLDTRPPMEPFVAAPLANATTVDGLPGSTFKTSTLAELYDFPTNVDGSGETIAIIEMGGGYVDSDMDAYFKGLGLQRPRITTHGPNKPGVHSGWDREVTLDVQVAAAAAPGAELVVYFAKQNTYQDFVDTIVDAIKDKQHRPTVVSISWGVPEETWAKALVDEMARQIHDAAGLHTTVVTSSGDRGAHNGGTTVSANYPASDLGVLSCGGTIVSAANGAITSEVTWNDATGRTGGGVSVVHALPSCQTSAGVPKAPQESTRPGFVGRGVPDVSANASANTGYRIHFNGQWVSAGGTSAAAPLWAGLIARLNHGVRTKSRPRLGFCNKRLYDTASKGTVNSITVGDNGFYKAGPGWDACTGLGSPKGTALLKSLMN